MNVDIDGFTKLSEAGCRQAECQAEIVGKLAAAELTWQQAQHQALVNLAKQLDIQWDEQAHRQLLQMRNLALQRARLRRIDAEHFGLATRNVNNFMSGAPSLMGVTSGWISLGYLRSRLPLGATSALPLPESDTKAFEVDSWKHPDRTHQVWIASQRPDIGGLFDEARQRNYFPRMGGAAWDYLAKYLTSMSAAAEKVALELQAKIDAAEKSALELEKRDWDRLNHGGETTVTST